MIGWLIGFLSIALGLATTIFFGIGAWRQWRNEDGNGDAVIAAALAFCSVVALIVTLIITGLATGSIASVPPDGCYRIVTHTSTGVSSNGQAIVISGRDYTPIACPS